MSLLRNTKTWMLILAAMVAARPAAAQTSCWIYLSGDCHGWAPAWSWFYDDYNGSSSNSGACLHRAREYAQWCGLLQPGTQVNAAFNYNGVTVNAQVFQPGDIGGGLVAPRIVTYGLNWTPLAITPVEGFVAGLLPPPSPIQARLNPRALPLGNQMYTDAGPAKGYVYACDSKMFQQVGGPGGSGGPWVNGAAGIYDVTRKVAISGEVYYPNAYFSVVPSGDVRAIRSNGLPVGVPTGTFPVATSDPAYSYDRNPNPVTQQNIAFNVPRFPAIGPAASCIYKEVGITLDGVPLHGPLDSVGNNELAYELQDSCTGGPQPGGGYHRHALSSCTPHMRERAALVGYALDGFGIYSPFDENGLELTSADLDECHGRTSPVRWEGQWVNMYHYVMTRDFPYSVSCFKGKPTRNAFPQLPGAPPQTR